ncbi:leucine-rich repeat-containing protein 71 isoform X2 [Acanthopagrus latus]|uniref:leucine-rich repeat-containing protein 71 isoform X2 n=1 Tax=Acanthopagrus latus TaxID=8177 RepID=UPI00187BCF9C|nr:leucine-rich repeat-containing protein 71 isoform X2 [Acanthopagrus latus]
MTTMSRRRPKEKKKANAEDEVSRNTGQTPNEKCPAMTFDEYQCSGNVEIDFPGLCALLDMKDLPAVSTKQPASSTTESEGGVTVPSEESESQIDAVSSWLKPCLQVELENEDPISAKSLKVSGWKVDELTARVLQKMLPSLNKLQSLHFWQAGLTDQMIISLALTISLCSNLRTVTVEGNPLPERSFHILLSENSMLTHLSLRNNQIGDEGARLIGSALSTLSSANKSLLSLNLAFNSIGDAGAEYIAQGLRLNCALLILSLSNNQIGDAGAAHLAAILGEFALTHEEVVERRKLLLERTQSLSTRVDSNPSPASQLPSVPSSTSLSVSKGEGRGKKNIMCKEPLKKEEKPPAKSNKKSNLCDKSNTSITEVEAVEIVNPLLDQSVQRRDGELILPGNATLTSLNLAGNRITEKSLPLFLKSVEMQGDEGGLLRLCLQRNRFPPDCEIYVKIKELMALRDPLNKNTEPTEEEGQGA